MNCRPWLASPPALFVSFTCTRPLFASAGALNAFALASMLTFSVLGSAPSSPPRPATSAPVTAIRVMAAIRRPVGDDDIRGSYLVGELGFALLEEGANGLCGRHPMQ